MDLSKIERYYQVDREFIPELYMLQVELLKFQKFVSDKKLRVAVIFEGRDTAGKGSAIARFTQFLNPQQYRTVALGKPTEQEKTQWYFQRYIKNLPNGGELVFFDRSWYNRAVVEPVMGFCSEEQYRIFMEQVVLFENMISQDGIILCKFWFSIDTQEQRERIEKRLNSPLENWKVSPVDLAAQEKWEAFTEYKLQMFDRTSTKENPWVIVRGEKREYRRIQAMRYLLSLVDYEDKSEELLFYDPEFIKLWKKQNH